jgi:hypothetical protein
MLASIAALIARAVFLGQTDYAPATMFSTICLILAWVSLSSSQNTWKSNILF